MSLFYPNQSRHWRHQLQMNKKLWQSRYLQKQEEKETMEWARFVPLFNNEQSKENKQQNKSV